MNRKNTKKPELNENAPVQTISAPDEDIKRWQEYWPKLQEAALDSEEHFDKKIFAVSAGAIGFELSILQFVKDHPQRIGWMIASSICCISALLLNLIVQYVAKIQQDKLALQISELIRNSKVDDGSIERKMVKYNKFLTIINISSIVLLVSGIAFLAVFSFINLC